MVSPEIETSTGSMRSSALFIYGVALGLLIAWIAAALIDALTPEWLLIGAAVALALALFLHQRHASLSKGRRWRKTV